MNLSEILIALGQGKKLHKSCWHKNEYLYVDNGKFKWGSNKQPISPRWLEEHLTEPGEWSEWKDPNEVTFGELKVGETFKLNNVKFIKTNLQKDRNYRCVALDGENIGMHCYMPDSTVVLKCPIT